METPATPDPDPIGELAAAIVLGRQLADQARADAKLAQARAPFGGEAESGTEPPPTPPIITADEMIAQYRRIQAGSNRQD